MNRHKVHMDPVFVFWTGALTLVVAIVAQLIVVFNNIVYLSDHYGFTEVMVYSLAVAGIILVPIIDNVYGASKMLRIGGIFCFAYAGIITLTEHMAEAAHREAATWTVTAVSYIAEDQKLANGISWALPVLLTFLVVEFLAHFAGHGIEMMLDSHTKIKRRKRRK